MIDQNKNQIAVFAGGCFWCTEAIFKRLKGVIEVLPGYSGGNVENPTYEQVCSGKTGHAEAIQIEFDSTIISYEKLLEIFFYTHDPTTKDRQGNDIGTQYRSVVFYNSDEQEEKAEKFIEDLEKNKVFNSPILTAIEPLGRFYIAEDYHKNYFDNNKNTLYCNLTIMPKINKLIEKFNREVKEEYK